MGLGPSSNPQDVFAAGNPVTQGGGQVQDPRQFWQAKSSQMNLLKKVGDDFVIDGLFFNWMNLEAGDAWQQFPYQFEIHDGKEPLKTLSMPLAPQSISISVPAATTTTVTMRGITEEHNDAPLRHITISGTTGIMPGETQTLSKTGPNSLLEYAFANTIQAANRVKSTAEKFSKVVDNLGVGGRSLNSPLANQENITSNSISNAYNAIHNMSRFFDMYLAAKKKGIKQLFLSFYMHKDRMYYDCTLNNYSIRKVAGSMEYQYTVSLTAWRRRDQPVGNKPAEPITRNSASADALNNVFAGINQALSLAVKAMNEIAGILKGISKDFETVVLGPIKRVALLFKSIINVAMTIMDFPNAIQNLAKTSIKSAFRGIGENNSKTSELETLNQEIKNKNLNSTAPDAQPGAYSELVIPSSIARDESGSTADLSEDKNKEISDPFDAMFRDPQEFANVFDFFKLDELELGEGIQALIDDEIAKALALTSDDVKLIREDFESFISNYSETVGGGDSTYNRINNKGTIKTVTKKLSVEDIRVLSMFNDTLTALDSTIIFLQEQEGSTEDDYASYFADQARSYGIDFAENTSKFYVPFEFGSTLETMAYKYLGDDSRWIEIAAINALKAPYVDEEGDYVDFLASGAGNSFSLSSITNLYIGQVVELSSDTQRPEPRTIIAIDQVSAVESIISIKGEGDLAKFTTADNAKMRFFLPNTTNSNQLIAIPSKVAVNIPGVVRLNPDKEDLDLISLTAKADFMLNFNKLNTADIAFTGADVKVSRGMTNLIQAANVKILTQRGDLLYDPTFGNPIEVGSSTANIDITDTIRQLSQMFEQDPRFQSVKAGKVVKKGNAIIVDLILGVQNSQAYLPFSAAIPVSA